jgi:glycosyltransferase involved in cell wall biosynthesis
MHQESPFDVAHHVSWGTVSRPPLLWRLPIPFVWGPVGGGQVAPAVFLRYFGSWRRREVLRTLYVRAVRYRPLLRNAIRHSASILATNRETAHMLESIERSRVRLFLDSGIDGRFITEQATPRERRAEIQFLWVGKLEPRKCLPLTLEAISRVKNELAFRLLVAGEGPFRNRWESLTTQLGLEDRVRFLGAVPHAEMPALYRASDTFIFSSLQDSFGAQVLEAMAAGLPVIALDHQGVGTFLPASAGIKIPVTTPEQTLAGLAEAIRRVAGSYELRQDLGRAAWEYAKTQTWENRAQAMCQLYAEVATSAEHPPKY